MTYEDADAANLVRSHYAPPAPDVFVAVFGLLVIGLDDAGLHVRIVDPRTTRAGR